MKNFSACLLLFLTVAISQPATAGSDDSGKAAARATQLTKQLAQKTQLSEGQYVKVRQLNLRMISEVQAVQTRLTATPGTLDQQLAELQNHYEWDLAAILGPRKMAAYTQSKTDLMAFSAR